MPAVGNGFRYPFDVRAALEAWREKLGGPSVTSPGGGTFEEGISRLIERDRALEDTLGTGRWLPYTPVLTATTADPTLGTGGVAEGTWTRFGRTVIGNARIQFGSGGGAAAGTGVYHVSLPTPRQVQTPISGPQPTCGGGEMWDSSLTTRYVICPTLTTASTTAVTILYSGTTGVVTSTAPFTWAAGDHISINFMYDGEIA